MNNWTFGKRILLVASFLCVVIAIISSVAIYSVVTIQRIGKSITDDSLPGVIFAGKMKVAQGENMLRLGQLIIADTPERRKQISDEMAEITRVNKTTIEKYETTITTAEDRRLYDIYKEKRAAYVDLRNKKYMPLLEADPAAAKLMYDGPLMESYKVYNGAVDALITFATEAGFRDGKQLAGVVKTSTQTIIAVSIAGLIIGIAASLFAIAGINRALREISSKLNHNAGQVTAAANEVSASSQSLAEGASEQAASLEETSSSMEEMSSIVQANATHAQGSKDLANNTRQTATDNATHMQELKNTVSEARDSSRQLTEAMEAIKSSSDSIAQIIKTIDEIAFQTNILALNAAVEAARAGEAGMGFAVVADEVRNLAKRSADAARETTTIIEDSIRKSEAGVRVNDDVVKKLHDIDTKSQQVDAGLREILTSVSKVDEAMGQIATASKEQTQGIGQINIALSQMDKVTQTNAASAEETAGAAAELNSQAAELRQVVVHLLSLVEGHNKAGSTALATSTPTPKPVAASAPRVSAHPTTHTATPSHPVTHAAAPARTAARSNAIPMESDFRDMN